MEKTFMEKVVEYQHFINLSPTERKRVIYQNFVKYLPDSIFTQEIILKGLHLSKPKKGKKAKQEDLC